MVVSLVSVEPSQRPEALGLREMLAYVTAVGISRLEVFWMSRVHSFLSVRAQLAGMFARQKTLQHLP